MVELISGSAFRRCVTTHTPLSAPLLLGEHRSDPGYLQHHWQQQAICGRLYRVINKCAVLPDDTFHIMLVFSLRASATETLAGREEAAGGNEGESVKHSLCICRFSFKLLFI